MSEEYTCIECENLYDDTDGDTDERMCNKCLDQSNQYENVVLKDFDLFAHFVAKGMTPRESVMEMIEHNQDMLFTRFYLQGIIDKIDESMIKDHLQAQRLYLKGSRRKPNIQRSSTVHYPDWDKKKKIYIVPPNKRKINKTLNAIKSTPEYKLGKKLLDGEISNVTIDSIIDKESGVE